jgi:hypothetical protein
VRLAPTPDRSSDATPARRRPVRLAITAATVALAAAAGVVVLNQTVGSPSSTTPLEDGQQAVPAQIVAGRTVSRFHALPWLGHRVVDATCAEDLPARVGAAITCDVEDAQGRTVEVAVRVTAATATAVTWEFQR